MKYARESLVALTFATMSGVALGHPQAQVTGVTGAIAGFLHPMLGLDHLLAMVTVGLLAAQRRGRHLWELPGSFLLAMMIGGALGIFGLPLPGVEVGIALSVAVLGVALTTGRDYSLPITASAVGLFGFVHGHAHGSEIPALASPVLYTAGFVVATALLHVVGVLMGSVALRSVRGVRLLRVSGAAIGIAGVVMVLSQSRG